MIRQSIRSKVLCNLTKPKISANKLLKDAPATLQWISKIKDLRERQISTINAIIATSLNILGETDFALT